MNNRNHRNDMPDRQEKDRKRRILIVEDEFVNRELLKAYLEGEYDLTVAENGAQATAALRTEIDTLSLVLLDLNLPDMHGMDILDTQEFRRNVRRAGLHYNRRTG
ncbi:MAG: response regulator, partial [Clostridia bacterium]|nr:response regulator [Clostridia bacterium]